MIKNIFLQMLSFDEIGKLFQIPVDIEGVETVTSFVPYVVMGIFGLLAFIGLRIYKNLVELVSIRLLIKLLILLLVLLKLRIG